VLGETETVGGVTTRVGLTAGAFGSALAFLSLPFLPALLRELADLDTFRLSVAPDLRMVGFSVGLALLVALVLGIAPALRGGGVALAPCLPGVVGASPAGARSGKLLVAAQVALSMVLLVGAVLLGRTVLNLHAVPIGYDPENLAFVSTANPPGRARAYVEDLLRRLEAIPGSGTV
jgi:hypothetical protein